MLNGLKGFVISLVLGRKPVLRLTGLKRQLWLESRREGRRLSLAGGGDIGEQEGGCMKQPWLVAFAGVVIGLQSGVAFAVNPDNGPGVQGIGPGGDIGRADSTVPRRQLAGPHSRSCSMSAERSPCGNAGLACRNRDSLYGGL